MTIFQLLEIAGTAALAAHDRLRLNPNLRDKTLSDLPCQIREAGRVGPGVCLLSRGAVTRGQAQLPALAPGAWFLVG